MHSAGVRFVFVKASQGSLVDSRFAVNWSGAKTARLLRGAYLFYDYRYSVVVNVDTFKQVLSGDPGELPPVIDVESLPGMSLPARSRLLADLASLVDQLIKWRKRMPIVYSNPATFNYLRPLPAWLIQCPLWIAHYGVSQSNVPVEFPFGWHFWQWTDRMDGAQFGVSSRALDGNCWNGSLEALHSWAGISDLPPASPLPISIGEYRCLAALGMIVRDGAGVKCKDTGERVKFGQRVIGYERKLNIDGYNWLRIDPMKSRWIADRWMVKL